MKFPVLFPVSREFASGDGFDYDRVRHHAVRRLEIFPGRSLMAPIWQLVRRVLCLCEAAIGIEGPILRLFLWSRNPVSQETETAVAETGSKLMVIER